MQWRNMWNGKRNFAPLYKKGKLDAVTIGADNCCELGKWLHGDAKRKFGRLAIYTDTVNKHAAFHKEAGKVATAINAGQFDEASNMLGMKTPYAIASSAVGVALMAFNSEVSKSG